MYTKKTKKYLQFFQLDSWILVDSHNSTIQNWAMSLVDDNSKNVSWILKEVRTIPQAKTIPIAELSKEVVPNESSWEVPAKVLFPWDWTNASILETSKFLNDTIYTVRFGISNQSTERYQLPSFWALAIIVRDKNGKIHFKDPIATNKHKIDVTWSRSRNNLYMWQLNTIAGKIGKWLAKWDFSEYAKFIELSRDGEYTIHDISDPGIPGQFKYIFSRNSSGNKIQCQATITYDDSGVPSVYIGALINGNEKGMPEFILWLLDEWRKKVNESLQEKGVSNKLEEGHMAKFERTDEYPLKMPTEDTIFRFIRMFSFAQKQESRATLH